MSTSLYRVCCAASEIGIPSAANNIIAVMHVNVLDFKLPPLPLPAECIMSRTFAGLVLWCPKAGNVMPRTQSPLNQPANILRHNDIRSLVRLAPHDACALTLILALTVVVALVA